MRAWVGALWVGVLAFVLPVALLAEPTPSRDALDAPQPTARPLLWKIERQPPAYLYGTIHVPDPRVLALPDAVERAIDGSDVVYTEIALDSTTQQSALRSMTLPSGKTLDALLPEELYSRVDRFLIGRGMAVALFQNQKVWVLATLLPMLDYMGRGQPLDEALYSLAVRKGKRTEGIETVEMQVAAMEAAGPEGELALLRETLDYLEKSAASKRDPMAELIDLYLQGDEDRISAASFAYVDRSDLAMKRVIEALVDRRNDYMAKAIAERLRAEPRSAHFFAIGAMHYPGQRGLLAQLRGRGLRITRLH